MRNTLRKKFPIIIGLAMASALMFSAGADTAKANPKDIPSDLKLEFSFNLIGYPEGKNYTGGCGNGRRIFVNRNDNHAHINVTNGTTWDVVDCNATRDRRAELQTADVEKYFIFVRILGKPGGHLKICADTFEDHENGDHLCLLGTIDLTRGSGQSKFSVAPSSMFDAKNENIVWSVETNTNYRIAQFRVYRAR